MVRRLTLLLTMVMNPGIAAATMIVMDPDPFTIDRLGEFEAHMTWTLLEGSYDSESDITSLLFQYQIQQVTHQPSGTISFDAPILYAERGPGGFIFIDPDPGPDDLGYWWIVWEGEPDDQIIWAEIGLPPPTTVGSTLLVKLEGIPTAATFTMSGVAESVAFHAVNSGETAIPEPLSTLLFATGSLIVGAAVRRHRSGSRTAELREGA